MLALFSACLSALFSACLSTLFSARLSALCVLSLELSLELSPIELSLALHIDPLDSLECCINSS